jgi:hypothetical protein
MTGNLTEQSSAVHGQYYYLYPLITHTTKQNQGILHAAAMSNICINLLTSAAFIRLTPEKEVNVLFYPMLPHFRKSTDF